MLVIEDIEGFDEGGEERVEQVSEDIDEMEEPEKDWENNVSEEVEELKTVVGDDIEEE